VSLASELTSREYHEGTPLANRLGLQLARTLVMNRRITCACAARTPRHPAYEALIRDGIAALPNFLPEEVFASILREFTAARHGGLLRTAPPVEDNGVIEDVVAVGKNRQHFPVTYRTFADDQALRELVGDVIGRTPDQTTLIISVMRQSPEPVTPLRMIGSNYIHADIHFPTVKAWLYLNDIDETNGAFVFAPGSHRLSLGRLSYEYEASVRVAKAKASGTVHSAVPYGLARMPREDQLLRMGIREKSFVGKANTLVIANTMGFHRRGSFQPNLTRNLLMLRFGDRSVPKSPKAASPK
jgi:hypothetical protein